MPHALRTDANQAEIVAALRAFGALVWVVNRELDLVVYYRGHLVLLDCKVKGGRLTRRQCEMVNAGWPIAFPESVEEALSAVGIECTVN